MAVWSGATERHDDPRARSRGERAVTGADQTLGEKVRRRFGAERQNKRRPAFLPAFLVEGLSCRLEAEPCSELALERPRQVRAGRIDEPNRFTESLGIIG